MRNVLGVKQPASTLQREIKQKRPFRSRRQEGVLSLLRTADLLRRTLSTFVERHGITLQQYNVLRILRGAGNDGLPTLEIAGRMIEQSPGITRLMDRLETKRLVRRERCPHDRRQVLCFITPAGLTLLAGLDDPMHNADESFLEGVPAADVERLIRILDGVRGRRREAPIPG
jgi:DNA-binding MarR family transcriptional regulator